MSLVTSSATGPGLKPVPTGTASLILLDSDSADLRGLGAGARLPIGLIPSGPSPLQSIAATLANRADEAKPEVLHLVAHGRSGAIRLAGHWLDAAALTSEAAALAAWGVPNILLWSCHAGADTDFVATLSELTGATVVATSERIGAVASHTILRLGDRAFDLGDLFTGQALDTWGGTLATPTAVVNDSGLNFTGGIKLTSTDNNPVGTLYLYKNVYLDPATGQAVDALVTVEGASSNAVVSEFDSPTQQFDKQDFFQPNVTFARSFRPTNAFAKFHFQFILGDSYVGPAAGTFAASSVAVVNDEIVIAGASNNGKPYSKVNLSNVNFTAYDIDGQAGNTTARQYIETSKYIPGTLELGSTAELGSQEILQPDGSKSLRVLSLNTGDSNPLFGTPNFDLADFNAHKASVSTGITDNFDLIVGDYSNTSTNYLALFGISFGGSALARLGDFVFKDLNSNGIQDSGEPGVANVLVSLLSNNGDVLATRLTSASGGYAFNDLAPGTYSVRFTAPNGLAFTQANSGSNDSLDSDADVVTGISQSVVLAAGEINNTIDAGLIDRIVNQDPASLGNFVWEDKNANGIQEAGELGIPNVTVNLLDQFGATIGTTLTDPSGFYNFTNLTPGTYGVQFVAPLGSGYQITAADQGLDDAVDSDANPADGKTVNVTLAPAENNTTLDAGFYKLASIGDFVWEDINRDGRQDSGEPGVGGVVVNLVQNNVTIRTTQTDAAGKYSFTGLTPGSYAVDFIKPIGYDFTTRGVGVDETVDSDPDASNGKTTAITLSSGDNNITRDAGLVRSSSIELSKTARADVVTCPTGPIGAGNDNPGLAGTQSVGGIDLGNLTTYVLFFADGRNGANWQGATKGFVGDVAINGVRAQERTSGSVPFAGTIYTNDTSLGAWQNIVNASVNTGQAFGQTNQTTRIANLETDLVGAFQQINALTATTGFTSRSSTSLNGLNTQNGINETYVINVTSGFGVNSKIEVTGDAGDVYVLRWDNDANFADGYEGDVKFQSGGAIVPLGGLTAGNFIHVAGNIQSSGGGSNPASPYPQGPITQGGTGSLINGGSNFNGGGFFTGFWLTTGTPQTDYITSGGVNTGLKYGSTSSLSNAIFVGGWYSLTDQFSMTSGTSAVKVCPNIGTLTQVILETDDPFNPNNIGSDSITGQRRNLITYTFKATNTGSAPIDNVRVGDNNATPGNPNDDYFAAPVLLSNGRNFGDTNLNGLLDSGESWYFQSKDYATATGSFTNTAAVFGDIVGGNVSSTDTAFVNII